MSVDNQPIPAHPTDINDYLTQKLGQRIVLQVFDMRDDRIVGKCVVLGCKGLDVEVVPDRSWTADSRNKGIVGKSPFLI